MAKDGDGEFAFDLNEPPLEHGNGFDLNLPLNEFGVVDFDYVQHLAEHVVAPIEVNHRRKDMTEEVRKQVYQALLARSKNGKLGKKDTRVVADQFGLHIRAVQRLWKRGKIPLANFIPVDLGSRKKGRVGRKAIPVDLEQLRNIPIKDRMTIEDVCSKLNMSKWRIQRFRDGNCIFDGKIGCFPLVTYEPARRGNERTGRVRGDLVMKPITSITRDVIRDFMINKVLPAIRAKRPREDAGKPIFIQQDNAPSHLKLDDLLFCEAAIQAIQYKKNAKTVEALIPTVQEAFMEYSPHKANRMFLTLQSVLKEAMKVKGSNNFKIPHMKKGTLEREDRLPTSIHCQPSLLDEAEATLAASNI
uniref:Transposon protein, putative, Mariner sub-class n=2 Tax=Oryza sativa subsp. japonica TaxID=39947 RepID=Q8W5L6_ORYSJ|nr:Unknown protein [Oryza sativa]AAP51884.1 transposon protein, putative, Mariner sub-class [Oryza sativa Japonica Group]